jgi:hypothetical protein
MNSIKKLYKEFFGLKEAADVAPISVAPSKLNDPNVQSQIKKGVQVRVEGELDEAELINHMGDYKGGVEYVLIDPAQAKVTAADISQWAQKKGFTIVQQTISPSGKVGYFYFRLGENPYKESKRIQGYISQLPMIKHFRFNIKNQETPEQPRRREI